MRKNIAISGLTLSIYYANHYANPLFDIFEIFSL